MKKNRTTINFVKFLALTFMMMLTATVSAQTPLPEAPADHLDITESACATFTWRTVTYTTSGTYTDEATGDVLHLTINALPTAEITAGGATTFCAGGSVTLTATEGASYLWSTGAITQSIDVSTTSSPTVTVTNAAGCSVTSAATSVTVNALPTAEISAGSTTSFCSGGSVTLTASAGSSWLWSTGATTQSIDVSTTSSPTVTVTNAAGCSATSAATSVTVTGVTTHTTTLTVNAASYTWTAGNGNTYTSSTTVDYVTGCHTETLVLTLITTQIPSAATLNFCKGQTIATAKALGGESSTLKFYKASIGGSPVTETTALATGTLFVTETTLSGESNPRVSRNIVVNNLPATPSVLATTESGLICKYIGSSTPVTFNATATGAVSSYIWTVPTGAAIASGEGTSSIGVNFAGASTIAGVIGAVTVKSVDSNGCISSAKSLTLTTKLPTAPSALTMTSGDTTLSFEGIVTLPNPTAVPPTPAVKGLVGLNTLAKITKVGPYMGTSTVFTLTAPEAVTAASYVWTLPTGVTQLTGGTSNVITVKFADVTPGTTTLPIVVQSVGGCGLSSNRTLSLARAIPGTPKGLTLTNSSQANLNTLAKITKVGPYTGTDIAFTLTATPFIVQGAEATSYAWVLPTGVVCTTPGVTATTVSGSTTIDSVPTPWTSNAISSPTNTITVNFSQATGVGNLELKVFGVNGSGNSVGKSLVLTRALPSAPTALMLTDDVVSTSTAVTKVGPYTGKTTALTLKATPFATQGAEATSFNWSFPSGVNVTEGATLVGTSAGVSTWTGTASVLTIDLADIGTGVTSIPLSVYAVNGTGTSATAKTLTLGSAAPATPAIVGITGTTSATTFSSCETAKTYTATAIQGATYTWTIPAGAAIDGATNGNVIVVNYSGSNTAVGASSAVTCYATNGTGTSATKSLTVKRVGATCSRLAPEAASATEAFSVVAYPNPATEGFKVKSSNGKSFGVQVYDMLGRSIEQRQMSSDAQIGSNYAKGIYNVIVNQGASVKTLRVIKQ